MTCMLKARALAVVACALALVGALSRGGTAWSAQPPQFADVIYEHGEIYTPKGWAGAIAVKDGIMIAVGSDAEVSEFKAPRTRVVELHGAAVLPGLHDMHVHPTGSGQMLQLQCLFPQGSKPPEVLTAIRACVLKSGPRAWITGGQWDAASFGSHPPERAFLDRIAPDNPVILADISGHSAWANTKALQIAGITAATPDPPGGIIERDSNGEPTGILRESAGALVRMHVPPYTLEQNMQALSWALHEMLAQGITSFTDAGVDGQIMQAYAALADEGRLKQRVKACILWRPLIFSAGENSTAKYIAERNLYSRERFSPTCIKIVLDGVPTDGHTAAMVEPYADATHPEAARARGLLMVPTAVLDAAVTQLDAAGFTVKFHAAGDAAVRAGLDAIAAARRANGFTGHMHEVGHCSFVQMSDIVRARGIAATLEMSPYIWYPNPIIPDIAKAIGPERMKRWIPVKDAIDAGALVVPGSDWAVVPSVNPWIAIETLVTRQQPGGGGQVLGAVERITLKQAIDLFTINSAREMGQSNELGSLARGLRADFVVLDRNPFRIPITEVHATQVLMTVVNGEIVYRTKA